MPPRACPGKRLVGARVDFGYEDLLDLNKISGVVIRNIACRNRLVAVCAVIGIKQFALERHILVQALQRSLRDIVLAEQGGILRINAVRLSYKRAFLGAREGDFALRALLFHNQKLFCAFESFVHRPHGSGNPWIFCAHGSLAALEEEDDDAEPSSEPEAADEDDDEDAEEDSTW